LDFLRELYYDARIHKHQVAYLLFIRTDDTYSLFYLCRYV